MIYYIEHVSNKKSQVSSPELAKLFSPYMHVYHIEASLTHTHQKCLLI